MKAALVFLGLIMGAGCASSEDPWKLAHLPVPQHPHLAPNGRSNMHNDAYMTDTYGFDGPQGPQFEVRRRGYFEGANTCATIVFDSRGRLITTAAAMLNFSILLIDPATLEPLTDYPLPPRDPTDPLFPYNDTSGATYFVMDRDERIIFSDAENALQIIRYDEGGKRFEQLRRFDLSAHVVELEHPARDHIQMAIYDWEGRYLWFTSRYGMVGTLRESDDQVRTLELKGEEIQNSFAVGEDGVYVISDHALYRFSADAEGRPVVDWRFAYDRGTRVKPSNFNQGSGTTPQLFGEMVAIADNAEPRMNVLFVRRRDGREACRLAVFDEGQSTTENALVGWARKGPRGLEYSVIVDNNYGIDRNNILGAGRAWRNHVGGLARVDMVPDGEGFRCFQVWQSDVESSQILPKLSLSNGLLYLYTYEENDQDDYDFFFTALDAGDGSRRFSIPTGSGLPYANFGSPLALQEGGAAFLGTLGGLLKIADRPAP